MLLQESAKIIAENARHVKINRRRLYDLTDCVLQDINNDGIYLNDYVYNKTGHLPGENYPPFHILDWMFVVNLLNFGFCTKPTEEYWRRGRNKGYYAICSAVNKALLKHGIDIVNPMYYSKISKRKLKLILKGSRNIPIPLINKRLEALHDSGEVLLKDFAGTFENCVRVADGSALRLLKIITNKFRFFYDAALYEGDIVAFHSRAQMLIVNIWSYYENTGLGRFNDINLLTSSTCYRISQLFWFYGIFEYEYKLKSKIVRFKYLESGSPMEVEIRACTIHAIEMMKNRLRTEVGDDINPAYMNQILIYIWRQHVPHMFKNGYHHHLTQSIYY